MTLRIRLTEAEQEALAGVRLDARLLYLQGLKPYMDYASGLVGVKRRVSYQAFRELLEVTPERGSVLGATQSPTTSALRNLLVLLERRGLLVRLPQRRRTDPMVFRLPLAACDDSFRPREQRHSSDIGAAFKGTTLPNNDEPYVNHEVSSNLNDSRGIEERHSSKSEQRHTSLLQLNNNNNACEASPSGLGAPTHGKTSVDQWEPCSETWGILRAQGVDPAFAQEKLPSYRIYWRDRGEVRHSWSSHFVNYVIGQWRRYGWQWKQEVGNEASKVRSGGSKGRESLVDRVERKSEEWLRRRHAASEAESGAIDGEVVAEDESSLRV